MKEYWARCPECKEIYFYIIKYINEDGKCHIQYMCTNCESEMANPDWDEESKEDE